jgi:hypothetical protein
MNGHKYLQLLPCTVLIMGSIGVACAQELVVDQSLQFPALVPRGNYHYDGAIATLSPGAGQEFTPTLNGLDFVDVSLHGSATGHTFRVAIHQGTITAPVLGLSEATISPGKFSNNQAHFTFSSRVPLLPGTLYVLEIIQEGSYSGWGVEIPSSAVVNGQIVDMNYYGGRFIYNGVPQDSRDLLFREGIVMPGPGFHSTFNRSTREISLQWTGGMLQSTRNVGPDAAWSDVTTNGYYVEEPGETQKFFRVRYP